MTFDRKAFGARLAQLREARRMTQEALAKRLDVSVSTYCRWEWGRTEPQTLQLVALSLALEVSIDELVDGPLDTSEPPGLTWLMSTLLGAELERAGLAETMRSLHGIRGAPRLTQQQYLAVACFLLGEQTGAARAASASPALPSAADSGDP